ncbi:thioredoxin family protein [Hamadaea tsunoensis]|uniref:thioredoxin family protein n=1 Tax=Hamadaea tsunoensis TaxID=53368 RepID=UPI0004117CB4|nr:thioredoxin family protein [Hamadaea tsunoensis]
MAVNSFMVELGTPAHDFTLPNAVDDTLVSPADFADAPALLVAFLSNHCPYVRHIESAFGELTARYAQQGLAVIAISANDAANYPDDAPEQLAEQAKRAGFTFPYAYDEAQVVAQAYKAACTPDLFLYGPAGADGRRPLVYRGQFDDTRPNSGKAATGASLATAVDAVLAGEGPVDPQYPSAGCSIKWKPGNDPA